MHLIRHSLFYIKYINIYKYMQYTSSFKCFSNTQPIVLINQIAVVILWTHHKHIVCIWHQIIYDHTQTSDVEPRGMERGFVATGKFTNFSNAPETFDIIGNVIDRSQWRLPVDYKRLGILFRKGLKLSSCRRDTYIWNDKTLYLRIILKLINNSWTKNKRN